jgi:membrane protein implicated in regulation of membrane protease activity
MEIMVWLALIVFFVVLEIATVGLTSIWLAGGSLAGLICAAFGMGIVGQIIVFAVVSFVLLYFTRPWALKYLKPHLVRTNVCVTEQINNVKGTGTAVMNGLEWTARSVDDDKIFEPGEIVTVKEIKGVTLYVTESNEMPKMQKSEKKEEL